MPYIEMADLLDLVLEEGASDLHIPCYSPPVFRLHGEMTPLDVDPLTPADTERLVKAIASEGHIQQIQEVGTADFGFGFADKARFRVSAFKQKGFYGTVLRQIPNKLLTFEQIGNGEGTALQAPGPDPGDRAHRFRQIHHPGQYAQHHQ